MAFRDVAVNIKLLGDKKLQRKLNRLASKDAKKIVNSVLREGAKPIVKRAKELVPKDSGALKRSIKVRAIKRSRVRTGVRIIAGDENTRTVKGEKVTENPFYSSFVELGTRKQPAQSFMVRARDEGQPKFDRDVPKLIAKGIVRLGKKG